MRDSLNNFLYSLESEYISFFYKDKTEGIAELRLKALSIYEY